LFKVRSPLFKRVSVETADARDGGCRYQRIQKPIMKMGLNEVVQCQGSCMRMMVRGALLLGVALSLTGCASARSPQQVIAPTYSYVQADLAMGVDSGAVLTTVTRKPLARRLPPTPAAPGFDTLVFAGTDARSD
jgi:hypothetical protein